VGIREKLNENPRGVGGVIAVLIVVAIGWIYYQNRGMPTGLVAGKTTFYTEDDGATYFPDSYANLAKDFKGPKGKDAVRAYVFRYGKETPFVAYMEKYSPAGKQILATFYADAANQQKPPPSEALAEALIKKPAQTTWVSAKGRVQASAIKKTPTKGDVDAEPVQP
jgi:hypothetical protein